MDLEDEPSWLSAENLVLSMKGLGFAARHRRGACVRTNEDHTCHRIVRGTKPPPIPTAPLWVSRSSWRAFTQCLSDSSACRFLHCVPKWRVCSVCSGQRANAKPQCARALKCSQGRASAAWTATQCQCDTDLPAGHKADTPTKFVDGIRNLTITARPDSPKTPPSRSIPTASPPALSFGAGTRGAAGSLHDAPERGRVRFGGLACPRAPGFPVEFTRSNVSTRQPVGEELVAWITTA